MELTQSHRAALLNLLEKTMIEQSITKLCMAKIKENQKSLLELYEIDDYLQKEMIEAIKKALTQNEIDY
jgi:hypothetical protein